MPSTALRSDGPCVAFRLCESDATVRQPNAVQPGAELRQGVWAWASVQVVDAANGPSLQEVQCAKQGCGSCQPEKAAGAG